MSSGSRAALPHQPIGIVSRSLIRERPRSIGRVPRNTQTKKGMPWPFIG
jgi:hypothetical protein